MATGATLAVTPEVEGTRRRSPLRLLDGLLVCLFIAALVVVDLGDLRTTVFAWDFRAFYDAGEQYLHLESPYVAGSLADLTGQRNFVYPPPAAALFAPLALLPYHLAAVLFVCLSAGLVVGALYLLGVRDPRCYAAMLIGAPALDGLALGTVSPVLVFLLALVWRHRDRTWVSAGALTLLVLTKLFLWPVAAWLIATRRVRAVLAAAAACALASLLASLPLGVGVLPHYASLLRTVSRVEGPSSVSLVGLTTAVGGSERAGVVLSLTCGAVLLAGIAWFGRHGDDERAFRFSVVAALALTPIVWNHYLLLLFVPLALRHRRFSPLWLATAWVVGSVGGGRLDGVRLVVALCALWVAVLAQSGLADDLRVLLTGKNRSSSRLLVRLAGTAALAASFLWVLASLVRVVPAVAALRSGDENGANGTATLRFLRPTTTVCAGVLTAGLTSPAVVQVVDDATGGVLVAWRMHGRELHACGRYSAAAAEGNVAGPFSRREVHLSLRLVSSSGKRIVSGEIVPLEQFRQTAVRTRSPFD